MPWCEDCARFWNPNTLRPGGECPTCGRTIAEPVAEPEVEAPWHFKVLVASATIYLLWRAAQLAGVVD